MEPSYKEPNPQACYPADDRPADLFCLSQKSFEL